MLGVMALLARAPTALLPKVGRGLGRLGLIFARSRRHIAATNLKLCFPEQSEQERDQLLKRVFLSTGISLMETTLAWLRDVRHLHQRVTFTGIERMEELQADGKGILLVGAHFATLDLAGAFLGARLPIGVVYRKNKNPVIEWIMTRGRDRCYEHVIERKQTRQMVRYLRDGGTLWYAADQDYGRKHSVFAPFFGVPAASITATSRLARLPNVRVMFMSHFRSEDGLHWSVHFRELPQRFPTGDDIADATTVNAITEEEIRRHPEQYLWQHRLFKTRPPGVARPY